MTDIIDVHRELWHVMHQLLQRNRFPQAILFVGARHAGVGQFVDRLLTYLLCMSDEPPCGQCRACRMMVNKAHPDIHIICPESSSSPIKIEQIREVQQTIFQTPQLGARQIIVIDSADKMNSSAANALLKILEEPPAHAIFMLKAEQISSMPATILSRCQKYVVPSPFVTDHNYLSLTKFYPPESARAELMQHSDGIINGLCQLMDGNSSPCTLASKWVDYTFEDLLWLLYLITAQAITYQIVRVPLPSVLINFSKRSNPVNLFHQLEKIYAIMRKINHTINMNQTLVLEDLLIGYLS